MTEEQVVLHGDHLLRMKGEIVHEFKCKWVVVMARRGTRLRESGAWITSQCSQRSRR